MTDQLSKIESKLDKLQDDVNEIKIDVAVLKTDMALVKIDLNKHVVRSDRLEEDNKLRALELEQRIRPVEDHIKSLRSYKAIIVAIGALVAWSIGMVATIVGLVKG